MLVKEISQQYLPKHRSVSFFKCRSDVKSGTVFFDLSRNTGDLFEIDGQGSVMDVAQFNKYIKTISGLLESVEDCLITGSSWHWVGSIPTADGGIKWLKAEAEIADVDGRLILNGAFFDITEYKEIEAEFQKNRELLTETGKLAKIGTWEIDLVNNKLYWSDEVYEMHEFDRAEAVDMDSAINFYPAGSRAVIKTAMDKLIADGIPYDIELPLITAKGNRLYTRSSGKVVFENGKAVRVYGIIQNITASKQQEETQRVIFEYSTDAHLLIDDEGIIDCNNAAVRMLKFDNKADMVGKNPSEFSPEFQPDGSRSDEKAAEVNQKIFERGFQQFEWMHTCADGTNIIVEVTITPVTISNRPVLLVVWHDITAQKKAVEKLKSSEALLRDTQQLTHSGSWEIDLVTGKNYWSAEAFRIFGLEPKGYGPTTEEFDKMIHPDDREKYLESIRMALKGGSSSNYDLRIIKADGEVRYIQAIGKPFHNENGQAVKLYGAIIDITDHKRAEEEIRAKQEQLKSFIEFSPAAIAIFDKEMRYIAASNIWKKDYKLERKNIIGVCHYDIFPESSQRWKEIHQRGFAGEVLSNPEDSYVRKNGRVQWFRWEIRPWYEKDDEIGGIIMFTETITERKEAEQALVKAKEQAENAAQAKTQFLSTMSHEIRTPMNAVIGFTHLLLQNPREDQVEYLKILKFSGENLLVLINDILDFSKIEAGKLEFEDVDFSVKDLIRNTRSALVQRANEKGIQVKLMIDEDLPEAVIGDPVRLGQILTNLITNAIKFTNEGKVLVAASLVSQGDDYTTICFEVKDTGIGIPEDKQETIFESFTQASSDTTRKYGGTGLGLTITKRLLEMQGSQIKLESEPGKGSTFYFDLKLKRSSLKLDQKNGIDQPVVTKSLKGTRILLAEDNQINVLLAKQFLKQWDIECDVAENGAIAVQLAKTNNYDMILMDLQMPEMDGYTAAEEIRKLEPVEKYKKLPIIALTASAMLDNKDRAFVVGMDDYVSKPFNPDDLYKKIAYYRQISVNRSENVN
jgi:PAS domain S-box-containing protein